MSWVIALLAAALLAYLEKNWAHWALKKLRFTGSCDKVYAEPGEEVTWSASVENRWRLPVPFVRVWESFPSAAKVRSDPAWVRAHCRDAMRAWHVEEKLSLLPRQRITRSMRMAFDRRGVYTLGACRLAAGDLLGFTEKNLEIPGQTIVIIPERSKDRVSTQAVGGFLGDISVRRFIQEDPILTVGFRDYTGREPMKAVSWTRTAATGTMQVKQFDHTAEQTVQVLLNVENGTPEALEEAFRLTRSVCEELERKKIPFGLRTNGNLPGPVGKLFHLADGLGQSHLSTILYGLGRADYTCYQSFRYLTERTLRHRRNNEAYIVITPKLSEDGRACLRRLEQAVGNGLCVLTAEEVGP